jgi:hypothetical protein
MILILKVKYMIFSDILYKTIIRFQFYNKFYIKLSPPFILSDNRGILDIYNNPINYQKMKYINIHYHFIHYILHKDKILIDYIPDMENPIDILIKIFHYIKY